MSILWKLINVNQFKNRLDRHLNNERKVAKETSRIFVWYSIKRPFGNKVLFSSLTNLNSYKLY